MYQPKLICIAALALLAITVSTVNTYNNLTLKEDLVITTTYKDEVVTYIQKLDKCYKMLDGSINKYLCIKDAMIPIKQTVVNLEPVKQKEVYPPIVPAFIKR